MQAAKPIKRPTIQVESNRVKFELDSGRVLSLPASYGTFHDPTGDSLPKCTIFFGPFRKTHTPVQNMSLRQEKYFGPKHRAVIAVLPEIPKGGWRQVGKVVKIFYARRGVRAPFKFHHPFKGKPLSLSRSGRIYKLDLGGACLVDDRGYVTP